MNLVGPSRLHLGLFFGGSCGRATDGVAAGPVVPGRRLGAAAGPDAAHGVGPSRWASGLRPPPRSPPRWGTAGMVLAGGVEAYTRGRQWLFPLCDLPRHTAAGRTVRPAADVLIVSVATIALS